MRWEQLTSDERIILENLIIQIKTELPEVELTGRFELISEAMWAIADRIELSHYLGEKATLVQQILVVLIEIEIQKDTGEFREAEPANEAKDPFDIALANQNLAGLLNFAHKYLNTPIVSESDNEEA